MKKFIILILFISFCTSPQSSELYGSADEVIPSSENEDEIITTSSTTTSTISSTTTTLANDYILHLEVITAEKIWLIDFARRVNKAIYEWNEPKTLTYQEYKEILSSFIEEAQEFNEKVRGIEPPNKYDFLKVSQIDLNLLSDIILADIVELLAGAEESDTGQRSAAALSSFNFNSEAFVNKVSEIVTLSLSPTTSLITTTTTTIAPTTTTSSTTTTTSSTTTTSTTTTTIVKPVKENLKTYSKEALGIFIETAFNADDGNETFTRMEPDNLGNIYVFRKGEKNEVFDDHLSYLIQELNTQLKLSGSDTNFVLDFNDNNSFDNYEIEIYLYKKNIEYPGIQITNDDMICSFKPNSYTVIKYRYNYLQFSENLNTIEKIQIAVCERIGSSFLLDAKISLNAAFFKSLGFGILSRTESPYSYYGGVLEGWGNSNLKKSLNDIDKELIQLAYDSRIYSGITKDDFKKIFALDN